MSVIAIIGSGFSGLSAAAYLAKEGHEVHVFEKNAAPGGRARRLVTKRGYTFDMGPSWYWMPDVFESFFRDFGHEVSDFYKLNLLNPAFEIVFGKTDSMPIPANRDELRALFEQTEPGSGAKLDRFLKEAQQKYELSMEKFIYQPGLSVTEFINAGVLIKTLRLSLFSSFSKHVRKYFSHPKLIALMEFPVLFLGAMPEDTPALYSLMNYAGLCLGTWYPEGGFGSVVDAMVKVATKQGARFHYQAEVKQIHSEKNHITSIRVNDALFYCDAVVAAADYHHVEQKLLPDSHRNYDEQYWNKKVFAPSSLIFYVGVNKKISRLNHHTLFFDEDMDEHARAIYKKPEWPKNPLFYVSCTSKSDNQVAPEGHENLFILIPLAPGLKDNQSLRDDFFDKVMLRLESFVGEPVRANIDYCYSYCIDDFITDYNAYKGNAYGLANTLSQTAVFKPRMVNAKLKNLFYAGQLTVPGPGVPPSIISGKIAAELLSKTIKPIHHESTI
jgi:phytoene desaturase